jgi:hypothetical protein
MQSFTIQGIYGFGGITLCMHQRINVSGTIILGISSGLSKDCNQCAPMLGTQQRGSPASPFVSLFDAPENLVICLTASNLFSRMRFPVPTVTALSYSSTFALLALSIFLSRQRL